MKKSRNVRSFLSGVLITLLVVGMVPSALAAAGRNITVYPGVSIYMDDTKLNPTDANGNPVEAFIYNGTTYLPVRAVSEALGQVVQWDGRTNSVYIGKHASDTPAAWLSQMEYFSGTESDRFYTAATEKDNLGDTHAYCITRGFDRTYVLNGQYSRISGTLYQTYNERSNSIDFEDQGIYIYGDGKLLFSKTYAEYETGIKPVSFNVDLTGVLELRVVFADGDAQYNWGNMLSLGDVGLYT